VLKYSLVSASVQLLTLKMAIPVIFGYFHASSLLGLVLVGYVELLSLLFVLFVLLYAGLVLLPVCCILVARGVVAPGLRAIRSVLRRALRWAIPPPAVVGPSLNADLLHEICAFLPFHSVHQLSQARSSRLARAAFSHLRRTVHQPVWSTDKETSRGDFPYKPL
jgi:hypothetical protein